MNHLIKIGFGLYIHIEFVMTTNKITLISVFFLAVAKIWYISCFMFFFGPQFYFIFGEIFFGPHVWQNFHTWKWGPCCVEKLIILNIGNEINPLPQDIIGALSYSVQKLISSSYSVHLYHWPDIECQHWKTIFSLYFCLNIENKRD